MNLRIEKRGWVDRLEKLVIDLSPRVGMDAIREHVKADHISAYEVYLNDLSLGFFLARGETLWNGERELVILHALAHVKGKTPLASLLSVFLPQLAKEQNYKTIRIHSERRGMDAILQENGFELIPESTFVKKVA